MGVFIVPTMRSNLEIKTIITTKPRHSDPPGLWLGVTLVSITFHIWLLWALRSAVWAEKAGNVEETIVPIEAIAIAPEAPILQSPPNPAPNSANTSSSVSPAPQKQQVFTKKEVPQLQKRQTPRPQKTTPQPRKQQVPSQKKISQPQKQQSPPAKNTPQPQHKPSAPSPPKNNPPSPTSPETPTPSPKTPTPSPQPDDSLLKPPLQSSLLEPPPKPLIPSPPAPNASPTPPPPSPVSDASPTPPPSPVSGNRFIATLGAPQLTQPDRDIPDRLARRKQNEKQFDAIDYLTPLGIEFKGELAIEVVAIIDENGKPSIYPQSIKVLAGYISSAKAAELATKIIEQWQFEPTYMGGQPIPQEYFLRLSTRSL